MNAGKILSSSRLKAASPWLFLTIGIIAYLLAFFYPPKSDLLKSIYMKIGDILIVGVLIGYISNSEAFFNLFKNDLCDIIYGKKFLSLRNDLLDIWENISKEVFKNKFEPIHKEFLKSMKGYFPLKEVSYYDDYEVHTYIEWVDKQKGIIKVVDEVSFELKSETTDSFTYPLRTSSLCSSSYNCYISINGENWKEDEAHKTPSDADGKQNKYEHYIKLEGRTSYPIKYKREVEYNIEEDQYIGFKSLYILNGMRVSLEHPKDIHVTFIERGTQKEFIHITGNQAKVEKRYKGIILPKQGYIFVLTKIN